MIKKIFSITLRYVDFFGDKVPKMFLFKVSYIDLHESQGFNLVDLFCDNQWLSESSYFGEKKKKNNNNTYTAIYLTVPNTVKSIL